MSEEYMIDVVSFTDEDGTEFEMELIDEFEYKGEKYVVLADLEEEEEDEDESEEACECGLEGEQKACECSLEGDQDACKCSLEDEDDSLYIMKVVAAGDGEEFVPVEEDILEELISYVEDRLYAQEPAE